MSIRVKPIEPAVRSGLQRRPFGYVPLNDPHYKVNRNNPKFQQVLDEVQRMINTR